MSGRSVRYLTESSASQTTLTTVFHRVAAVAQKQNVLRITLVVPRKSGFRNTAVAQFLGEKPTRELEKGEAPRLIANCSLHLESAATFPTHQTHDLILGVHIGLHDQYRIDTAPARFIAFVPWNEKDGKAWQATWQPTVWGPDTWKTPPFSIDPQLDTALQKLTRLGHDSDRQQAKGVLSKAVADGHLFRNKDLFRWALQHNWSFDGAVTLEKLGAQAKRK